MTAITVRSNRTSAWHQFVVHARCETKTFWATPSAFVFIVAMPVIAYAIIALVNRNSEAITVPFGGFHLTARDRYYTAMMVFATFAAAFTSTAIGMGSRRLDGRFRRLRTTAAKPIPVMAALLVAWCVIALVTDALITVMATVLFGVRMDPGQAVRVLLSTLLAIVAYMALGFAASLFFRSPESAAPLSNLVFFPMVFLSGIFYDVNIGSVGEHIIDLLPLRPMLSLLAGAFGTPSQAVDLHDVLVLVGWTALSALMILWRFRWTSESEPRRSRVFFRPGAPRRATD